MDTLKQLVRDLDTESWPEFLGWVVGEERARRDSLPAVEQAEAELIVQLQDAGTVDAPTTGEGAWARPTSKLTAYRPGATVTHQGRVWRNERRGMNGQEPGERFSGWVDVTPEPEQPEVADTPDTPDAEDPPAQETRETEQTTAEKPEPRVPTWHLGERISQGDPREHNGDVYIAQKRHTTTDATRPDKNTGHWLKLD